VVFKGFFAAATSVALMATPVVASAAETAATARAATTQVAPADENVDGSELRGGFIIPLIALIAIILGILAATHNGGKTPNSP
jgi:glycerol uptake facilitator-like aquaporin